MKTLKRIFPVVLSGILIFSMSASVLASTTAAAKSSEKEEVIYATLDANGSLGNIYVVNSFSSGGDIVDYGNYSGIKMLNTTDAINQNGDEITYTASKKKTYYQGYLDNVPLPWNISLKYYLDKKECTAEEIAGKSGALEIRFKIEKNENCSGTFYEDYALQAAFTLDTENCFDISAPDATIANVGSNKQITYTILPGEGIDTSITANVTDFEMDAVSINGIHLNLDIEIDDKELKDKVSELIDAAVKLDDGALGLSEGSSSLSEGASALKDGASGLSSGISSLDNGIMTLLAGMETFQNALESLSSTSSSLTSGSSDFLSALNQLKAAVDSVSFSADEITYLTTASEKISQALSELYAGAATLSKSLGYAQYKALMSGYGLDIDSLTDGNSKAAEELSALIPALKETLDSLSNGALNVGYDQYKALMSGYGLDIDSLAAGNTQVIAELSAQISSLTTTLSKILGVPGYADQAAQLEEQIALLSQIMTLLQGDNAAINGMESYLDAVSAQVLSYESQLAQLETILDSLEQIIVLLQGDNAAISGFESYLDAISASVSVLTDSMASLTEQYSTFNGAIADLADALGGITDNLSSLAIAVNQLVSSYSSLDSGIDAYTNGVAEIVSGYLTVLEGVSSLAEGSKELLDGSDDLYEGTASLYDGVISLLEGAGELANGTGEFRSKTEKMNDELTDQINTILNSIGGSMDNPVSFVSVKNTNVDSVQFAITTAAIKIPADKEAAGSEKENQSFWEKLIALFR